MLNPQTKLRILAMGAHLHPLSLRLWSWKNTPSKLCLAYKRGRSQRVEV